MSKPENVKRFVIPLEHMPAVCEMVDLCNKEHSATQNYKAWKFIESIIPELDIKLDFNNLRSFELVTRNSTQFWVKVTEIKEEDQND